MGNPFEGWKFSDYHEGVGECMLVLDDKIVAVFSNTTDARKFLAMAKAFGEMKEALSELVPEATEFARLIPAYGNSEPLRKSVAALASAEAVEKMP